MITISGKEYALKNTIRNFFVFESLAGRNFEVSRLQDWYLLFYATIMANNADFSMEFAEFIEVCDEQPEIFKEYHSFFEKSIAIQRQSDGGKDEKDEKGIKKKRQKR